MEKNENIQEFNTNNENETEMYEMLSREVIFS